MATDAALEAMRRRIEEDAWYQPLPPVVHLHSATMRAWREQGIIDDVGRIVVPLADPHTEEAADE